MPQIIIAGGTGLIGNILTNEFISRNSSVYIITRNPIVKNNKVNYIGYDEKDLGNKIKDADVLINLAGASIGGRRWNSEYKKLIYTSRIETTKKLANAVLNSGNKNILFISSSATGYYGSRNDEILTEISTPGNDFLANLCKDWENEIKILKDAGVKTSIIRTGIVLTPNGGALERITPLFKYFIGGSIGNGSQYWPWIHYKDLANIIIHLVDNELNGVFNAVSPSPVTNREFSKSLGKILKRPSLIPVPKFGLRIVTGEFHKVLLSSQRAIPKNILDTGFKFDFNDIISAFNNIYNDK